MTNQQPLVRVGRCPNCGAIAETVRPSEVMACTYCGSWLERGIGTPKSPIASQDDVQLSTVYLARAEQLRRVREQLGETESRLETLRNEHAVITEDIRQVDAGRRTNGWLVRGGVGLAFCLFFASVLVAEAGAGCFVVVLLASLLSLGAGLIQRSAGKKRRTALAAALAQVVAEGTVVRDERDRIAARVAELEADLDELGERL